MRGLIGQLLQVLTDHTTELNVAKAQGTESEKCWAACSWVEIESCNHGLYWRIREFDTILDINRVLQVTFKSKCPPLGRRRGFQHRFL